MLTGVILVFSSTMNGCKNQNNSHKAATAEELSQMNKDFAKAINAKDATAAANLYAEDATLLPPNEPLLTGRGNIQKYWQGAIDAGISDVSVLTIATGSDGNLGYEIGRYQLSIRQSDGNTISEKGKYTELLKRSEDGKWKSIYGMWSTDTLASQ